MKLFIYILMSAEVLILINHIYKGYNLLIIFLILLICFILNILMLRCKESKF